MSKNKKPDGGWRRTPDAAECFGLTLPGFHQSIRPLLKPEHIRKAGRGAALEVFMPGALEAWSAKKVERAIAAFGVDADLLTGDSPALDRLRIAKAKLAEMDLAQRQRTMISMTAAKSWFGTVAAHLRRGLDTLQRQFGRDAYVVMKDCLTDAKRDFEHGLRRLESHEPNRGDAPTE